MRKIKFMVWDREKKTMFQADELLNLWSQYSDDDEAKSPGIKTVPHVTVVKQAYRGPDLNLVVGRDCDLMQYTGIEDKNGKECFEGDLVMDHGYRGVVEFGTIERLNKHGVFYLNLSKGGGTGDKAFFDRDLDFEIIGNIYENPELVEK